MGNKLLFTTLRLTRAAYRADVDWVWENPARSLQWEVAGVRRFLHDKVVIIFDWCRFGRKWRKSTRLVSSSAWVAALER